MVSAQPRSSAPGTRFPGQRRRPLVGVARGTPHLSSHPPGSCCKLLREWSGCALHSAGEETPWCSRVARGRCQCAVCAQFLWGPRWGPLLLPGPGSTPPHCSLPRNQRWVLWAGGEPLACPWAGASPITAMRHRGIWPHVKVGWPRASTAGGGRWHWSRSELAGVPSLCWSVMHLQVHPGPDPALVLEGCRS